VKVFEIVPSHTTVWVANLELGALHMNNTFRVDTTIPSESSFGDSGFSPFDTITSSDSSSKTRASLYSRRKISRHPRPVLKWRSPLTPELPVKQSRELPEEMIAFLVASDSPCTPATHAAVVQLATAATPAEGSHSPRCPRCNMLLLTNYVCYKKKGRWGSQLLDQSDITCA
jgi:hypothetical protein